MPGETFSMPFIYCLASEDEVLYVGRTNNLKRREKEHRNKRDTTYTRFIPASTKWEMICLEEVAEEDAFHAEGFYYQFLEPKYNKKVPGRTFAEYQQSEACKEYNRKYSREYEQTEIRKEYRKNYSKRYMQTEAYKESKREYYRERCRLRQKKLHSLDE